MPTFLFTDIENSTRLWEKYPAAMPQALARHDAILRREIEGHGGRIIKHTGDGVFAVFEDGDPLGCALAVQKALAREEWGEIGELRVRIALHAGEAVRRGDDYFGPAVNRTARLLAAGWGGQVLLTSQVLETAALPPGADYSDLGFHFFKDLGEPQQVYGLRHPDLPLGDFPPLRSLSGHPHNLPPQPTPFLGREEELAEVLRLLGDPSCRLLTLTGPGGMGKTRLALQAAAEQVESFAHGVYFVPLAPLSAPAFIPSTIAEALRFSFYSRENPKVQLLNYLREKSVLLVLDNFEHLVEGAGLVAEILACAPHVKVLATSRERLNLHGEWVFPLAGLPVPSAEQAEEVERYSAVQLFVQGARRVQPGFVMAEEERPAVVRICRMVEGVPLGIELAASWVRVLSCREIAQEIERSADFLATAMRDIPERHRSLRAVFDYSWDLLSAEEQAALRQLAVFRGGFCREGAQAVAGASLWLLSALVDKSLLRRDAAGRYDMLEVLRQYAEAKGREFPEEGAAARGRHSAFYCRFLLQQESPLKGARQREALEQIGQEIENVRAAWQWAVERRDEEKIGQALESLYLHYEMRSWFLEGAEAFGRAVEGLGGAQGPGEGQGAVLGMVLARYAACCDRLGQYDKARDLLHRSLAIARRLDDRREIAFILNNLGLIACRRGDYAQAQATLQESLALARESGDLWRMGSAYNSLGIVASTRGDCIEARRLYGEGLNIFRQIGYRRGVANTLNNLAVVAGTLEDYAEAGRLYQESLAIFTEIGDRRGIAYSLNNLGHVNEALGNYAETRRLCQESVAIFRQIGDRWGVANSLNNLGSAACALGEGAESRQWFREALEIAMDLGALPLAMEALVGLARGWAAEGAGERAAEVLAALAGHPAMDQESRLKAEQLLAQLQTLLPPESLAAAQERGRGKGIEGVVESVRGEG